MEQTPLPPPKRRTFLATLLAGIGVVLTGAGIYPLWRFLSPRDDAGEKQQVSIPRDQISPGEAHFFNFLGSPAVVLEQKPGVFVAFSAVCTHLGCIIQWQPEKSQFLCPCHAGIFSSDGKVLSGPPPAPLESLPVSLSGDQLVVG